MAKTSKEIDNLTRDVLAAEKAGMSYGLYKAMQYVPDKKPERKSKVKVDSKPMTGDKINCKMCGKEFVKRTWNNELCSVECREAWIYKYGIEWRKTQRLSVNV